MPPEHLFELRFDLALALSLIDRLLIGLVATEQRINLDGHVVTRGEHVLHLLVSCVLAELVPQEVVHLV